MNHQILEQSYQFQGVQRKDFISVPVPVVADPISGSGAEETAHSEGIKKIKKMPKIKMNPKIKTTSKIPSKKDVLITQ